MNYVFLYQMECDFRRKIMEKYGVNFSILHFNYREHIINNFDGDKS